MFIVGSKGVEGNKLISQMIQEGKKFTVSRIGLSEVRWVDWYLRGGLDFNCDGSLYSGKTFTPTLRHRLEYGGVYGNCADKFFEEYIKGISVADIQIFWSNGDGSPLLVNEQLNIFNRLSTESIKVDCEVLYPYLHTSFWTKFLENKKVLIIYPFVETIKRQYSIKDTIWTGDHHGKIPNFELLTYKPIWSRNGTHPHGSWYESLNFMKNEISSLNFDIAILGCSHYGLPLTAFIKESMGKSAIYMGGDLQILFGIKGSRWDNWKEVNVHYNENWTRPIDLPEGYDLLPGVDKCNGVGCYW